MNKKMCFQFDYWPIMRSHNGNNQAVKSGDLKDTLMVIYNEELLWPEIELSKEGMELGAIIRNADIDIFFNKKNQFKFLNRQTWIPSGKNIDVFAVIDLTCIKKDIWKIDFQYNFMNVLKNELDDFNNKFLIGCEKFHFKINGEALLVNETVSAEKIYEASHEFAWQANTPILLEIEEFGHGVLSELQRFIQGVRFTIK